MAMKAQAANLLDRAIEYVAPRLALQRAHARARLAVADQVFGDASAMESSYGSTSSSSNVRHFRPTARSAAADQSRVLPTLRGQSRHLARTSPLALGAINTNVDRVVGTGLALSAQPHRGVLGWSADQAKEWKSHVQAEFAMWAESKECDLTGQQNFDELTALLLRSVLESGDAFVVLPDAANATQMLPYRLRLQVLEADRCGNPGGVSDTDEVASGVKMDPNGRPVAYHIYRRHPGALQLKDRHAGDWIEAVGTTGRRRILHCFDRTRPEQPRGIPYLAPVVECLKQISTYTDAEIQAAVVSSMFTVFVTTESGSSAPIFAGSEEGGTQAPAQLDDEVGMGQGAVVDLAPGEKVEFADPTRPNTAFEPFVLAIVRQIGVALGLPYELLIKQFNASYSASKAALLDAWQYLRRRRKWLALNFCQPVYETWLTEAVATGRVSAPGFFTDPLLRWAYTQALWVGDSQGSINPKDEVAAYRDAIDARLCTRERAEWELFGTDFDQTLSVKAAEEEALKANNLAPAPKAGAAAPEKSISTGDQS